MALLVGKARVGGAQQQVGDQAVKLPVPALDGDEAALLHLLRRYGQAHLQALFQPAANDVADWLLMFVHVFSRMFQHEATVFPVKG